MTKEQKEAIETMQHWIEYAKQNKDKINKVDELIGIQETVLNLIKEQEKEIDCLKNHVHYMICQICGEEFRAKRNDAKFCKKCVKTVAKEWYENLTDEQKAKRREQSKSSMRKIRERRKYDS